MQKVKQKKRFGTKRTVAIVVAAILCLSLAITAGATTMNSPLYDVLYMISPSFAQSLKPVNLSCEDNGIKMEVISANIESNEAYIYISMQDLTSDRIDETINLYDSYTIRKSFDSYGTCRKISYDEETKTATFLIVIGRNDDKDIRSGTVTFSVGAFMSKRGYFNGYIDEIDLSTMSTDPQTRTGVDISGGGGRIFNYSDINFRDYAETIEYLVTQGNLYSPLPNMTITAIGFVDEKFHVQMLFENRHETDSHGFVYLVDNNGNRIDSLFGVYFLKDANAEYHNSYYEQVFEISPEELKNCRLYGEFWSSNTYVNGDWEITFNLEDAEIS